MKRRTLNALTVLVGALVAGAAITAGPVSAAPPKSKGPETIIYSDTFTPLMRFPDGQALQNYRYYESPGTPPNLLFGGGHDAFFNSPDLTIGSTAMSAVSAEVCMRIGRFDEQVPTASAIVFFGVQDIDRNVVFWSDPDTGAPVLEMVATGSMQCETMTFPEPVRLVNHPHLVVAVEVQFDEGYFVDLDGVTYTLRPTKKGDIAPSEPWPY